MIKYQNNTISRLYGGNNPAYTLISGGTPIHGEYVQPSTSITINYTPVEYISNEDSSQFIWFPFDFYWSNSAKCQFKVDYTAKAGDQIIGDYGSSNDSTDVRWFKDTSNRMYFDVMTGRIQSTQSQSMFEVELGNYYVKNLQNNSNIVTGSAYNIQKRTSPFGVFGNTNDRGKIYYVKLYEGDTLVRDLIPVLDGNNVPCFFDKLNNVFYYNNKTGVAQYGNAGEQSGITINYNTELTTLTYDTPSGIIDTKTNLNASASTGVELIYSSDDTSIATVDSNGQIAPKASGTTTITIIAPTTTIGSTTYRGVQKRLQIECDAPSHTELEYLITDKNNPVRIDTGYYLKDNTIIKTKAKWDSNYAYLAHTEDGNVNSNHFYMSYGSSTREFYFSVYPKREWLSDRGYSAISPHSVEFGRYKVYIDDSLKYNGDLGQISDWSYPIILFGEQANFKGNFNLYYFQIFEGETLVKSFKPVIDSEGVVCLYEEVNKQYYYTSIGSFGHS